MGRILIQSRGLADALFTRTQQRVLGILFGQPQRSFQRAEIIRLAAAGTGAVHRELLRLMASRLIKVTAFGNQRHYQANTESPIFHELHGIILKSVGLAGPLREALAPFEKSIKAAFVYGSIAKGQDQANSDIDLMVLTDKLAYGEVYGALQGAEALLNRRISPNLLGLSEWKQKRKAKSPFVTKVQADPKIFIFGSEDDL